MDPKDATVPVPKPINGDAEYMHQFAKDLAQSVDDDMVTATYFTSEH